MKTWTVTLHTGETTKVRSEKWYLTDTNVFIFGENELDSIAIFPREKLESIQLDFDEEVID